MTSISMDSSTETSLEAITTNQPEPVSGVISRQRGALMKLFYRPMQSIGLACSQRMGSSGNEMTYRSELDKFLTEYFNKIPYCKYLYVLNREGVHEVPNIIKWLSEWIVLEDACKQRLLREPAIFVETDGRAHGNPMRMQMIGRATEDLLKKIQSQCPACGSPGFSVSHRIPGLPCSSCGAPTRLIQAEVFICQRCSDKTVLPKDGSQYADPQWCDFCNP